LNRLYPDAHTVQISEHSHSAHSDGQELQDFVAASSKNATGQISAH